MSRYEWHEQISRSRMLQEIPYLVLMYRFISIFPQSICQTRYMTRSSYFVLGIKKLRFSIVYLLYEWTHMHNSNIRIFFNLQEHQRKPADHSTSKNTPTPIVQVWLYILLHLYEMVHRRVNLVIATQLNRKYYKEGITLYILITPALAVS